MATAPSRAVGRLISVTAGFIWGGLFALYLKVWLGPNEADGILLREAQRVVDGTAEAPFQYRVLIPNLLIWFNEQLGWPVGYGEMIIDVIALSVGAVAANRLLRRLGLELWIVPMALYGAFVGTGMLWFGKFETITAFAAASVATAAILSGRRGRWVAIGAATLVLAGTRTDLILALAVLMGARWLVAGRSSDDLRGSVLLGAAGLASTLALKLHFDQAAYSEQVGILQLSHNLQPTNLAMGAAFLAPALAPFVLYQSSAPLREMVRLHRTVLVPVLAMVVFEVGSILVVGRVDEVRLLFPLVPALTIIGALGWSGVLRSEVDADPVPAAEPVPHR